MRKAILITFSTALFYFFVWSGFDASRAWWFESLDVKEKNDSLQLHGFLNPKNIEKYILSNLLSPSEIFSTFGVFSSHPSSKKWVKKALNINFLSDGDAKYADNYLSMQKYFFDFAGIRMNSGKGDTDILIVFGKDIINKVADRKAETILDQNKIGADVIDSIRNNITDIDIKNGCHISLFLSKKGAIRQVFSLVNTSGIDPNNDYMPDNIFRCLSYISFQTIGLRGNHLNYNAPKETQMLDLLSIFIIYNIRDSGHPFDDITPETIHNKINELFGMGRK